MVAPGTVVPGAGNGTGAGVVVASPVPAAGVDGT